MINSYKDLLKKINRNADGDTMLNLYRRGVRYKRNYGLKLTELIPLAKQITANKEMLLQMWESNIREMRILFFLVANPNEFTSVQLSTIVQEINNTELAEQSALNFYPNYTHAFDLAAEFILLENEFACTTGLIVISQYFKKNKQANEIQIQKISKLLLKTSNSDSFHIKNAQVRVLVEMGKINKEMNTIAREILEQITKKNNQNSAYLKENTEFQLDFFSENF